MKNAARIRRARPCDDREFAEVKAPHGLYSDMHLALLGSCGVQLHPIFEFLLLIGAATPSCSYQCCHAWIIKDDELEQSRPTIMSI